MNNIFPVMCIPTIKTICNNRNHPYTIINSSLQMLACHTLIEIRTYCRLFPDKPIILRMIYFLRCVEGGLFSSSFGKWLLDYIFRQNIISGKLIPITSIIPLHSILTTHWQWIHIISITSRMFSMSVLSKISRYTYKHTWSLLITWINFNPSMDE